MKKLNPDIGEDVLSKLQLAVPAIPLPSLTGLNSAFCNDVDPSLVYAQELMGLGTPGDMLLCISTSGSRGRQSARTYRHRTDRREGRTTQRKGRYLHLRSRNRDL